MIVTDGVFSMDGYIAPLAEICDLADGTTRSSSSTTRTRSASSASTAGAHPSSAGSRIGSTSTPGTFGKALGGASGGYVARTREIVELLRQRARPYLFSNTLAPVHRRRHAGRPRPGRAVGPTCGHSLRTNAALFRGRMTEDGFDLLPGEHPDRAGHVRRRGAHRPHRRRDAAQGVYVTAFSYPVVPKGLARIRVQLSAAHTEEEIRRCVDAFIASRAAVAA